MNIYEDYLSWKYENHELIDSLVKKRSTCITRFTSVIAVVDYLYERQAKKRRLLEEEELIFSTGFDYIYDQFHMLQTILEFNFHNHIEEMDKFSDTINLLLYITEFQSEISNVDAEIQDEIERLNELEEDVSTCLDKHEAAPEEYFILLNDITYNIFEKNNIELHTIDSIYYEIAVEYGIYDDDDYSQFNAIFSSIVSKKRQ